MQFYLVYSGPLSGSGNKSKPDEVRIIRDQLHPQLKLLWETHTALKRLRHTARVPKTSGTHLADAESPFDPPDEWLTRPLQEEFVDLCEPLQRGTKTYIPLVRRTLDLNCSLEILFLRGEDPGALVLQGGDLDNRMKTLFDALRVPEVEVEQKYPQGQTPTYCLLESDTLIAGVHISTGRLLDPKTNNMNEAHLIIDVKVRVLKSPSGKRLSGNSVL